MENPQFAGAILAFIGVIITLLWNAQLSRLADRRKFLEESRREKYDRVNKRNSVRNALIADIENFLWEMKFELKHVKDTEAKTNKIGIEHLLLTRNEIGNYNLLTKKEVSRLVYLTSRLNTNIQSIAQYGRITDAVAGITAGFILVEIDKEGNRDALAEIFQYSVENAEKALLALNENLANDEKFLLALEQRKQPKSRFITLEFSPPYWLPRVTIREEEKQ